METEPMPRVLIVDDDPNTWDLLRYDLSRLGYDLLLTTHAEEALQLIRSSVIDTIVSDITMPAMDGLEMLFRLRNEEVETPIIFLTGYATIDKVSAALRMGAFDFMQKPYDAELLRRSVAKAVAYGLSLRSLEKEIDLSLAHVTAPEMELRQLRQLQKTVLLARKQRFTLSKKGA